MRWNLSKGMNIGEFVEHTHNVISCLKIKIIDRTVGDRTDEYLLAYLLGLPTYRKGCALFLVSLFHAEERKIEWMIVMRLKTADGLAAHRSSSVL